MQKDRSDVSVISYTVNLKEGDPKTKKKEILEYFEKTNWLYEELFSMISEERAFYIKAEPLRHPLIFYFGHTATFYLNKFNLGGYINEHVNPRLEAMFAIGLDENEWDDEDFSHYDWPSVKEVQEYRKKARQVIRAKIEETPLTLPIEWDSFFWAVMMCIEHERLHFETSAVIMRQLPVQFVQSNKLFRTCPIRDHSGYDSSGKPKINKLTFPYNELKEVKGGKVVLGKKDSYYGWDNEYGRHEELLQDFKASKYLVSNLEYLEFVLDGGYETEKHWTEEGWRWNRFKQAKHPLFWVPFEGSQTKRGFKYRTLSEIIDMPWDWPVETNYLEAKAFCNWKSEKLGTTIKLPLESEHARFRTLLYGNLDPPEWEAGSVGNINLEQWASSCPIDMNGKDGFYDVIGNVWQHSETIFGSFEGFKVHKLFHDFSTPMFYGQHTMITGGSWATTGQSAHKSYRVGFRRHFYQFAGIRYVESPNKAVMKYNTCETDQEIAESIDFQYGDQYRNLENYPKKCADICIEMAKKFGISMDKALDIGCGVGRATFELAKGFKEVIGFDISSRFFNIGARVKKQGKIRYCLVDEAENKIEYREFDLKGLGLENFKHRASFYQQDPCNIDIKKYNSFDLILISGYLDELREPSRLLDSIHNYMKNQGLLVIASSRYCLPLDGSPQKKNSFKVANPPEVCNEFWCRVKNALKGRFKEAALPVFVKKPQQQGDYILAQLSFFIKV